MTVKDVIRMTVKDGCLGFRCGRSWASCQPRRAALTCCSTWSCGTCRGVTSSSPHWVTSTWLFSVCVCVGVCVCVWVCVVWCQCVGGECVGGWVCVPGGWVCMCLCLCVCVCVYVCVCEWVSECMCVCMWVCGVGVYVVCTMITCRGWRQCNE